MFQFGTVLPSMTARKLQPLLAVLAAALAALALTACGSDDGESDSVRTGAGNGSAKSDTQDGKSTAQGSQDGQKPDGAKNDDGNDGKGQADSTPDGKAGDDSKNGKDTPQRTSSPQKKKQRNTEPAEPPSTEPAPAAGDAPCPSSLSQQACNELLEAFRGEGALSRGECPKALTDQQCTELKAVLEKVPN